MFGMVPRKERPELLERPFRLLREEFEPIFARLFGTWPVALHEWRAWPHGFEMTETEKEYVVRAELPGFEPSEIEVSLRGPVLTIEAKQGEKPREGEAEPTEERPYARMRRSVTLPEGVEMEKLEAVYRHGVLEVTIPKTPEVLPRRIEVKT
jgi:HSP20 family protein